MTDRKMTDLCKRAKQSIKRSDLEMTDQRKTSIKEQPTKRPRKKSTPSDLFSVFLNKNNK